jgi:renalase
MKTMTRQQNIAVVGAGIAGLACARTLVQAGHAVTVFEKNDHVGGRAASIDTPFGSFDHGAQYFTVRDPRFEQVLGQSTSFVRPWSANAVRVLDPLGRVAEAALPTHESHFVGAPCMDALARVWAQPLVAAGRVVPHTQVMRIETDALDDERWQLHTLGSDDSVHVHAGFDTVLLAVPVSQAAALLRMRPMAEQLTGVQVAPCWTLMLAFPQAAQPGAFGPQWNAARSTHHRVAWLARESSKPQRSTVERWTVQASPAWSQEHLMDAPQRVRAKLQKAFAEITGIRAEPGYAEAFRWAQAKTLAPLGRPHLWDAKSRIGVCGDWCLGHRVEDAFVSGLELALAVA